AEHLRAHPRHLPHPAGLDQPALDEARGCPHRPDRVRRARADADLVEVERADGHGGTLRDSASIVLVAMETSVPGPTTPRPHGSRVPGPEPRYTPLPPPPPTDAPLHPLPARRLPPLRSGPGPA